MVLLFGLSWLINNAIENHFIKEDTHLLRNKISIINDVISRHVFDGEFHEMLQKVEDNEGIAIRIDNPDSNISFYASENIKFPTHLLDEKTLNYRDLDKEVLMPKNPQLGLITKETNNNLIEWQSDDNYYRGMQVQLILDNEKHSSAIVTMALNINHHTHFLNAFRAVLIKFTLIVLFISIILHWAFIYYGLLPLKTLAKKAKLVSAKDIKQRMPIENLPIEILGLSETLNNMLERLDSSFQRLENFSSDIAHELRTPINNLMMQSQVVLSKSRSKDEYLIALGSNLEECERLARMISDMLFLAKADNDQLLLSVEPISLASEVADLYEFYDALAEDRNIQLRCKGKAEIKGDKLMLRRVFNNLISNAIHHSFEGSVLNINIESCNENVTVEVINSGETIPAELLPHLFDRFYRADKARTSSSLERVGLGLAITKSIVKAHGGDISVSSSDQKTNFTCVFHNEC